MLFYMGHTSDRQIVEALRDSLVGGQGGAAHPDRNPDDPDPSHEEEP